MTDRDIEEKRLVLEEWKTVINTQMHFNEMIIRTRTTGISVVIGVYGAAALAVGQYPQRLLNIYQWSFHVSVAIVLFGLLLLLSIGLLDYLYYYRLLMGAVERGEQIDEACRGWTVAGVSLLGMTTLISGKVSRCRAIVSLLVFYGFPFLAGLVSLTYLLRFYGRG